MDLYKILGVARDATQKEISAAYRKLAAKHHPDRGGDPETFKPIAQAYEVLGDEERRKRYDETGEMEPQKREAFNLVARAITQVIGEGLCGGMDLEKVDILGDVVSHFTRATKTVIEAIRENKKRAAKLKRVAVRFSVAEGEENLLQRLVLAPIHDIEARIKRDEENLAEIKEALAIVKKYNYRFDPPDPNDRRPGSPFFMVRADSGEMEEMFARVQEAFAKAMEGR